MLFPEMYCFVSAWKKIEDFTMLVRNDGKDLQYTAGFGLKNLCLTSISVMSISRRHTNRKCFLCSNPHADQRPLVEVAEKKCLRNGLSTCSAWQDEVQ